MKLRRARTLRQLSLEDAARATKIRAARLADLEADVYTNFANLAYAKGFLTSYGKFLGVDVRPHLEAFADTNTFGLDDYQYLSEKPVGMFRVPHRPQQQWRLRWRRGRLVAALAAVGVLTAGMVIWFLLYQLQRMGDLSKLADHQEAQTHAAHNGGKSTSTSAAQGAGVIPAVAPTPIPAQPSPTPSDSIANRAPTELAMADPAASIFRAGYYYHAAPPVGAPVLPLPGDGGALRELTLGSSSAFPLLGGMSGGANDAQAKPGMERRGPGLPPDNAPGGYRFYVHIPGRGPSYPLQDQTDAPAGQQE